MIKLNGKKAKVCECFGITEERNIDIKADIDKFKLRTDDPLQIIQYIWNSEYFSQMEKIYLTYKMGQNMGWDTAKKIIFPF